MRAYIRTHVHTRLSLAHSMKQFITFSQVLEADGGSASGGVLLLVSDGEENVDPRIAEVTPTLVSKGVTVNTVLIGDSADKDLIELAAFTKGNSFFDSGSSDSTGLQSALKASVTHSESSSAGKAPIDVSCHLFIQNNDTFLWIRGPFQ